MENPAKIELKGPNEDPPAAESAGALAQVVSKDKKKKKKKKLSAKEREFEKLETESEKFLENPYLTNDLLISVAYWLKLKQNIAYKLYHMQTIASLDYEMFEKASKKSTNTENNDEIEINTLSTIDFRIKYDDFKLVSNDLDIPCSKVQLHAICKLLDPTSTKSLDYRMFTPEFLESKIRREFIDGMKFIKKTETTKYLTGFNFLKEEAKNFCVQPPMYIKIDLKLITFAADKEYKGFIKDQIVSCNMKIISLIEIIKNKTDIASTKISIFTDTSRSKQSHLDENKTLRHYGFTGAPYNDVAAGNDKTVLYYDYAILGNNDPILNCDIYFHNYKNHDRQFK